jgi:lysophospholipase L1-like esterase
MAIAAYRLPMSRLRAAGTVCAAAAVVAGLAGCAGGSSERQTADSSTSYYLALGDSLAAGVQPAAAGPSPQPKKIKAGATPTQGYVNDLYNAEKKNTKSLALQDLGCPGETTITMMDGGKCPYGAGSQLAQAVEFIHEHKIAFITLDIGGDDIDGCVTNETIIRTCADDGIDAINTNVPKILSALRQAAGRNVEIAVMTYYDPFLEDYVTGSSGQTLAAESVALTKQVNDDLLSAFRGNNVQIADVATAFGTYTPFATTTTYAGHTVPVAVANICQWTWMCAPTPLGPNVHANTAGYREIASLFEKKIAT